MGGHAVTEKAFPEDEMLFTTTAATQGAGAVTTKVVYERRFGPRTQMELGVPLKAEEQTGDDNTGQWVQGVGDVTAALKRVLVHSLKRKQVVSATVEFVMPTGSESKGLGGGTGAIEPFVTYRQLLPADWFIQAQAGVGVPFDSALAKDALRRLVIGKSFWPRQWGRMWSPMVEVLGGRLLTMRHSKRAWSPSRPSVSTAPTMECSIAFARGNRSSHRVPAG